MKKSLLLAVSALVAASFSAAPAAAQDATEPTAAPQTDAPTVEPGPLAVAQVTEPTSSGGQPPQQGDQPSNTAPAPTAATVTLTGAAAQPKKDEPAEEKAPPKRPKEKLFADTQVFLQTTAGPTIVAPGLRQTQNPTVDSSMFLQPRMRVSDAFQLRGRLVISREWTDNDIQTRRNETRLSDTTLQLFYRKIPMVLGVKPMVAAQVMLPTSIESQSRTMLATPGLLLQLVKPIEHFLGGDALIIANTTYSHPLYRQTTQVIDGERPYRVQCFSDNSCDNQLNGVANPSDILNWSVIALAEWGDWSPALFFLMSHQFPYQFRDLEYEGRAVDRVADRPGVRNSTFFMTWLDYHANAWLTAEIGYMMSRPLLDADGTYGNPFFSRYQDMRGYIGFNFAIDRMIDAFSGQAGDGGVVRAHNTQRRPVMAF